VVRYGAIGDLLQASSVFSGLKAQGYHVTLYTSPPQDIVVRHDPNIDAFYVQDRDQVPNQCLGEYWAYHAKKYDKWVNLSESVEGSFLAMPGRAYHMFPPALRHSLLNRNYLEIQHSIAGVPHAPAVHFYASHDEKSWAEKQKNKLDGFVIVWALSGSSVHKWWDGLDATVASLLLDFPQAQIVLTGDAKAQLLERGWEKEPRVHRRAGVWSIREALAFADIADLVIGPETGIMSAVSQRPMPKVVFLSHSTDENLTRDWVNTHAIVSENTACPGRGKNEAPACHQLHYGWGEHCPKTERGVSQCMADLDGEQVYKVIFHAIHWALEKRRAA
jgi:ADP-heptose:LPS heptosyltransferase